MTKQELENLIIEHLEDVMPYFEIKEDDSGQLIITTHLRETEDGELIEFFEEEEEDSDESDFDETFDLDC